MTDRPADRLLLDNTDDALARPLPSALIGARGDVLAAAADLLAIPEASLARPWAWIGGSEEEIRYAAYRAAEAIELAEVDARSLAEGSRGTTSRTALIIGPTTAARWDLHGLLVALDATLLDADPGGGEWSIRQTLGHTIGGQRAYAWANAWISAHGPDPEDPTRQIWAPDSTWDDLPDELTTEAVGTLDDLRARLDAIVDLSAERLAALPDEKLSVPTRWSGFPVPLGFRFGRWSSHIREHTIQVEKTFAMIGYVPDERARLIRNLLSGYGRAESVVFGRRDVDDAVERVVEGAAEARRATSSARAAAST